MQQTTIELVTYTLKPGVTGKQLAGTHAGVHEFLQAQAGFIYRSLSRDEQGLWYDIVYWQDMAKAKSAGAAFMEHPAGRALIELIDMDSCVMRHMVATAEILGAAAASAA